MTESALSKMLRKDIDTASVVQALRNIAYDLENGSLVVKNYEVRVLDALEYGTVKLKLGIGGSDG